MKLVRTAYIRTKEVYELDLDEELALDVENQLKRQVIDPKTIPHISAQTLAQCWEEEGPQSLLEYRVEVEGYRAGPYKAYLADMIRDILNDWLWSVDSYQADSDTDDWDDELEYNNWSEIDGPNPDFPDEEDSDETSPEGQND